MTARVWPKSYSVTVEAEDIHTAAAVAEDFHQAEDFAEVAR